MKFITLSNGNQVKVDDADHDYLIQFNWITRSSAKYPARLLPWNGKKQEYIFMHHDLLKIKGLIDHKNGDILDCRRNNLRIANKQKNAANCKLHSHNTSGYKGVSYINSKKIFRAYIVYKDKQISLGCFKFAKEAAKTYDIKALELFGEFARTNKMLGLL
jgi:AP2 domain/HNH endonuclease